MLRLYADYLNMESGALDSDYVFVNLFSRPHGHPLTYPAVYDLVGRLRRRTGIMFGPHMFRHTYATWLLRRGGRDGEREGAAGPRVDHHHRRHARAGGAVVTPATGHPAPTGGGLLSKLMATVRPQFRVDVYVPDPEDRVLGRPSCRVAGCDRSGWEYKLCSSHSRRWRERGCPDLTVFLADPGPPVHGRIELPSCTVRGCRYRNNSLGLCMRHYGCWVRSGKPDPTAWPPTDRPSPMGIMPNAGCRSARCGPSTPGTCSAGRTRTGDASWATRTWTTSSTTA